MYLTYSGFQKLNPSQWQTFFFKWKKNYLYHFSFEQLCGLPLMTDEQLCDAHWQAKTSVQQNFSGVNETNKTQSYPKSIQCEHLEKFQNTCHHGRLYNMHKIWNTDWSDKVNRIGRKPNKHNATFRPAGCKWTQESSCSWLIFISLHVNV